MSERLKSQASQDIFFIIDEGAKECNKMGIFFIGKKVSISKAILEIKLLFIPHHFEYSLWQWHFPEYFEKNSTFAVLQK